MKEKWAHVKMYALFLAAKFDTGDNDDILFDHNLQIEIIYNGLENQIINWSGDYY